MGERMVEGRVKWAIRLSLLIALLVLNLASRPLMVPDYFDMHPSLIRSVIGWPFDMAEIQPALSQVAGPAMLREDFAYWQVGEMIHVKTAGAALNALCALVILGCIESTRQLAPTNLVLSILTVVSTLLLVNSHYSVRVPGAFGTYYEFGWPIGFVRTCGEDSQRIVAASIVVFTADFIVCLSVCHSVLQRAGRSRLRFGLLCLFVAVSLVGVCLASVVRVTEQCAQERMAKRSLEKAGVCVVTRDYTPRLLTLVLPWRYRDPFIGISSLVADERVTVDQLDHIDGQLHHVTALVSNQPIGVSLLRHSAQCKLMLVDLSNCRLSDQDAKLIADMTSLLYVRILKSDQENEDVQAATPR